ncbi:MAG: short-chain dehydrogenase/reductase [Flavobacteriaceae bacterium]|nr:short-chain dehydrogenase/reductase [Flavobacteriaceae bacterium]|tara:strand:- start:1448 stop:2257 length:810 start_codon:yes stop_codon:yes gene_type:complete
MKKVVLISGASTGFGRSISKLLSSNGFRVYGTSRNPKKYSNFEGLELLKYDLTSFKDSKKLVEKVLSIEGKIDVLINNAGSGFAGPIEEISIKDAKHLFDTNFFGHIDLIQAILPSMRKNKRGLIVNITSIAGYNNIPFGSIYCASKYSMECLGASLNMELKDFGIRVVNIAPGDYKTEIFDKRIKLELNTNSPYYNKYKKFTEISKYNMDTDSRDPIEVAKLTLKIIKSKNPRIHYKVGHFLQKFSISLKKILPEKLYQKLMMDHYKI